MMIQNFADAEPVKYFHKMRNIEIEKVEKAKTNPKIILIGKSKFCIIRNDSFLLAHVKKCLGSGQIMIWSIEMVHISMMNFQDGLDLK